MPIIEEHQHIPIPEIVEGRVKDNVGMRPNSNRCVICGELLVDQPIVLEQWNHFLEKELENYDDEGGLHSPSHLLSR